MRIAGIWMTFLLGGLFLTGTALAQSTDDEEQGTTEESTSSSSKGAALAQSQDDEGQGQAYQAPGVRFWTGRYPSKVELQSALTQARSQAKSLKPSVSGVPNLQSGNERFQIGKLPKLGGR